MTEWPRKLGLVIFREGQHWIVQFLDIDLVTQGTTPGDVLRAAADALETQVACYEDIGRDPFEVMKPAPEEYWDLAARRKDGTPDGT